MSWFEVTAVPKEMYERIFDKIKFFVFANSDLMIIDKKEKYAKTVCKNVIKELFYMRYFRDFNEDASNITTLLKDLEDMKVMIGSLGFKYSAEDATFKEIMKRAFSDCYVISSTKSVSSCEGCRYDRPDQYSHMGKDGCLENM